MCVARSQARLLECTLHFLGPLVICRRSKVNNLQETSSGGPETEPGIWVGVQQVRSTVRQTELAGSKDAVGVCADTQSVQAVL